jgi:hypothetical protein
MPARKPMAAARRVALFEREIRIHVATAAIEVLFAAADALHEGQRDGDRYFGSTMITFDLDRVRDRVRDDCDAASARRVAELMMDDARVQGRVRALAAAAAAERAGAALARLDADVRVRAAGARVHIDVDVEGSLRA